ncbi:MAG TPA: hemolysin III family protein [Thermoanaerobaculia bacterium]|jgi:hemolysin III|nr:hemolysin III family protein [Thermoanaerobaculia bacterium]
MTGKLEAVSYSLREEIAHCAIHGVGILLSIAGLVALLLVALRTGDPWHVTACAVYGVTLILLYLASTLYHSIPFPRAKRVLRVLDHSAIYLLIAGTYTPFTLISLRGGWGWTLFGLVWGMAVLGIVLKVAAMGRFRWLSMVLYLGMGWLVLIALEPLVRAVSPDGVRLLFFGGLCYTFGTVFYGWRRLPYHHAVWHAFVLAGSVLHFFAILLYVVPVTRS